MKQVDVLHIDAFSHIPNKGNPAGVVLNGNDFTPSEMQKIAKAVGFNETAFVVPSQVADFRIRFFTPGHEMNLCGHATMGTVFALHQNGQIHKPQFTIETNAGVLPIHITCLNDELLITMQHAEPEFVPFTGSVGKLAASLGVHLDDIDPDYPIVYGSTGAWTLIIPMKSLHCFEHMVPNNTVFPDVLIDMPTASLHPICFEVRDEQNDMHARHFSSPYSGTIEDAVTGTGSGVMGAYLKTYVNPSLPLPTTLRVEQGHEIGKDGIVHVHVGENKAGLSISISGTAVFVKKMVVEL
jgi:PhzF family phenazine biosynthesis protein